MRPTTAALALLATITAAPLALAQTSTAPASRAPASTGPAATAPAPMAPSSTTPSSTAPSTTAAPTATAPVAGANSFTEGQARSRIEGAGFTNVTDLQKDDQGVWRGRASRNGTVTPVSLDYQGNVVAGNAPAR